MYFEKTLIHAKFGLSEEIIRWDSQTIALHKNDTIEMKMKMVTGELYFSWKINNSDPILIKARGPGNYYFVIFYSPNDLPIKVEAE